jgi:hypothetical protein
MIPEECKCHHRWKHKSKAVTMREARRERKWRGCWRWRYSYWKSAYSTGGTKKKVECVLLKGEVLPKEAHIGRRKWAGEGPRRPQLSPLTAQSPHMAPIAFHHKCQPAILFSKIMYYVDKNTNILKRVKPHLGTGSVAQLWSTCLADRMLWVWSQHCKDK